MLLWFYDPFTMIALIIVYIIGFLVLMVTAGYIAPKVARRFASRFSLSSSMLLIGLLTIGSSIAGISLVAYVLINYIGAEFTLGFIVWLVIFIVIANMFTYILSPYMINLLYGARHDEWLQKVVDEVALRLGLSNPPKAMIVNMPPNAFAYGNALSGRYVAVSRELIEMLNEDELRAVIGHELGHHLHRDNSIMLFMGLLPSIIYYLGVSLIRVGIIYSSMRLTSERKNSGSGGFILAIIGILAVVISFIVQILVLAFSRLREYYADTTGAYASSPSNMQRALAKLHIYYEGSGRAREMVSTSKLRTMFIYAFTEAVANPLYHYGSFYRSPKIDDASIDEVIQELKNKEVNSMQEFLSTHPPIPKRLRFLDELVFKA